MNWKRTTIGTLILLCGSLMFAGWVNWRQRRTIQDRNAEILGWQLIAIHYGASGLPKQPHEYTSWEEAWPDVIRAPGVSVLTGDIDLLLGVVDDLLEGADPEVVRDVETVVEPIAARLNSALGKE